MPNKRRHRGAHPEDRRSFAASQRPALRLAVEEYAWLLTRAYAGDSALALVGNRHGLTERQRMAVRRSACSDQALARRRKTQDTLDRCRDRPLRVDGYNLLITVESALSGGVILIARDGCFRDLAGLHGTYRKVEETLPAVMRIDEHLRRAGMTDVAWYLDRPVSNSGRLRALMTEALDASPIRWKIELVDDPDPLLAAYDGPVATSDSWILDRCARWVNLAADIIEEQLPECWKIDLR
jgi:hypothetical protein